MRTPQFGSDSNPPTPATRVKGFRPASYTLDGVKGVQSAGGTSRRDAVAQARRALGELEKLLFSLATATRTLIVDLPDHESAAAVALTVNAAGGATVRTVVLLTPDEVDAAARRSVDYSPPGS